MRLSLPTAMSTIFPKFLYLIFFVSHACLHLIATAPLISIKVVATKSDVDEVTHVNHSNDNYHEDINVGYSCIGSSSMLLCAIVTTIEG